MTLRETVSEMLGRDIRDDVAKQVALDQFGALQTFLIKKEMDNRFPNGFEDWCETHYAIVSEIEEIIALDEDAWPENLLAGYREQGMGFKWLSAERLTNEFEHKYKGAEWGVDLDYFDTVKEFVWTNI